ncbi:MAG: hypothetical protein K2N43_03920 [Lachnospiraceae bacterium]|nr:hypothetical protein [Lachnospiraceae bacterium]
MKKKMVVVGKVVVVVAVVLVGWYVMFVHFGKGPAFPFLPVKKIEMDVQPEGILAEQQLMAMVETEEDAKEIAEQYEIAFVSFSDGIALYRTDEDPAEVIARGQEQGYTQLYLNWIRTTMQEGEEK